MSTVLENQKTEASLETRLDRHCKTFETREPNWRVWGVETKVDKKYARSQRRYLGTSGNVSHNDPHALMGENFTLTILQMPPGHEQPMHHHDDEEEVFFVLKGHPTVIWRNDEEIVKRRLDEWDMVYNPRGQVHCIVNETDEDCYFQVMLGNPRPSRPNYADPELRRLQSEDNPDSEIKTKT